MFTCITSEIILHINSGLETTLLGNFAVYKFCSLECVFYILTFFCSLIFFPSQFNLASIVVVSEDGDNDKIQIFLHGAHTLVEELLIWGSQTI